MIRQNNDLLRNSTADFSQTDSELNIARTHNTLRLPDCFHNNDFLIVNKISKLALPKNKWKN